MNRTFRVLKPALAKVGNPSLAGQVVEEKKLGSPERVKSLLDQGAIEEIPPKSKPAPAGG